MYEQYLDDVMTAYMNMTAGTEIDNDNIASDYDFLEEMANNHCDDYEYDDYECDDDKISIIETKGKIIYQMPKDWKFVYFKVNKDRDFMDIIKQLKAVLPKKEAAKFSAIEMSKTFTSDINNAENLSICFSSDGNQGYWDLATMSMRGIPSCMNWKQNSSRSLVGTILDPYAGIIYLTDGKVTKLGSNIIARCVVRFVVDDTGKPAIFLEQLYTHSGQVTNKEIIKVFRLFIEQRTGLEAAYWDHNDYNVETYSIPASEAVDAILATNGYNGNDLYYDQEDISCLSYRDSGIQYHKINKFYNPMKVKL